MTRKLSPAGVFISAITLLLTVNCLASADSVSIDLSRVKYSSAFEQKQFLDLSKSGAFDPINFLLCLDSTANETKAVSLKKKLDQFYDEKLLPLQKNKTGEKLIKAVFKEIHDNLLTKYELQAHFEKILDDGTYNCVTASALYALSFERLGIPYQLRSTTEHVYVIANPGPSQFIVETTDPVGGAYTYNEQFKKNYIELLLKQKMISKQEYNQLGLEELFQKYFYSSDTIDMKQLIGYHFYNSGVELMTAENYEKASNQLMKAYYLSKKSQIVHSLSIALAVMVNRKMDLTDSTDVNMYFLFASIVKEFDYDFLYNKYLVTSEDLIMRQDDVGKFQSMSQYLFGFMTDSAQRSRFEEHYYFASAVGYYTKKDFIPAYENIVKAYCINNKNVRVKKIFEELNQNMFYFLMEDDEESADSAINKLSKAESLCGRANSNMWKFQMMMIKASLAFEKHNIDSGNRILAEAEKYAAENKLSGFEDRFIQIAYGGAKNHFYVRYEISKAKEYVARGLKLDPDNEFLKDDLEALNKLGDLKKPTGSYYTPPSPPPPVKPTTPRTIIVKTPH